MDERESSGRPWYVPAGLAIAFVGSLCGIGGGLFTGPLLHFVGGLSLKRATATALYLVVGTTGAATIAELLREDSLLRASLVLPLIVGVLVGAQIGFVASKRMDERRLKQVFVLVLSLAGARILFPSTPPEGVTDPATGSLWVPALVGMGGGFLAPLLGIGGGLLMVPGLFLADPGIGFAMARASALAAGSVGAARSLLLHRRAGNLVPRQGLPLAAGALVGAALGVVVVRQPGVVEVGRVLLGLILWAQALRFARALWSDRRKGPENPQPPGGRTV